MLKILTAIIVLVISSITTTFVYHHTQQADINYYQGHRLFVEGKFDKAIVFYEKTLAIDPERLDALKELSYCYQWTGENVKALEFFERVLARRPKDYAIKKSMAEILSWQKKYSQAIPLYQEVIAATHDFDAKLKLAEVYIWDVKLEKAKEILEEVLKNRPKDFRARLLLVRALMYSNESQKALTILEDLIKEKITTREKQQDRKQRELELKELLAQIYLINKDYKKAEALFQGLLRSFPNDLEARFYLGQVYLFAGDYPRARKIFEDILKAEPDNLEAKVFLADAFAYDEKFKEAEELYAQALAERYDLDLKRKLADVLSWDKKYDESLKLYDEIFAENKDPKVRLQKARVLGWQRRYAQALKEYQKILDEHYDPGIALEMKGKKEYWDNRIKGAINYYSQIDALGSMNEETMFDLSQVYAYQSMWKEAIQEYQRILNISPNHFRSQEGLEKARLISSHPYLNSGYELLRAESSGRDTNIRRQSFFNEWGYPLNEHSSLDAAYRLTFRSFADYGDILEHEGKLKFNYIENPDWSAHAFYDFFAYNKPIESIHTFGSDLDWRTFDFGTSTLSYARERLENNSQVIIGRFYNDNFKERLGLDVNKRLKLGLDYLYSAYSDDNSRHEPGVDILYYLSLDPKRFTIQYRYDYQDFNHKVTAYFSPRNFSTHSLAFDWRHYLNKEEIFFGANDLYYDLGYEVSIDSTDIVSHKFSGEINWDINKRLNFNIKVSAVHSSARVYEETNIIASLKYYF